MTNCLCFIEQEPRASPGTALSAGGGPAALGTPVWPQCPRTGPTGVAQEHQRLINSFPANLRDAMSWLSLSWPTRRVRVAWKNGGRRGKINMKMSPEQLAREKRINY